MPKYKVLITYVEAGMGHIVSAEAIANALETYYPNQIEVVRCSIFNETNNPQLKSFEQMMVKEVKLVSKQKNRSEFLVMCQNLFGDPLKTLRLVFNSRYKKEKIACQEIMDSYNPDMVLHTHYAPLHFSIEAKKRKKNPSKYIVAAYDPDPDVHGWWDRRTELFVVNNPSALVEAKERGFHKRALVQSNFILRKEVQNCPIDKQAFRKKYNLPLDNFTVILADGVYASANLKKYTDAFAKIDRKFTIIVVAGKNQKIAERYSKMKLPPNITMVVLGFTPAIYEYYCASDLFVTKSGPNAVLDSVFVETPIMVNYYASNAEKRTMELFAKEYGCGIYSPKVKTAIQQLTDFIDNPSLLQKYVDGCKKFKSLGMGEKVVADAVYKTLVKRKKN